MIFENYDWDLSDQPKVLKKEDKKLLRKGNILNLLKMLILNLFYYPYLFLKLFNARIYIISCAALKESGQECVKSYLKPLSAPSASFPLEPVLFLPHWQASSYRLDL